MVRLCLSGKEKHQQPHKREGTGPQRRNDEGGRRGGQEEKVGENGAKTRKKPPAAGGRNGKGRPGSGVGVGVDRFVGKNLIS